MKNLTFLIQCTDQVGLVTAISSILAQHQLNIIAMREFVDEPQQKFFTRIACTGLVNNVTELKKALLAKLPAGADVQLIDQQEKKIAVLVTKEYHCLADILVRDHFKTLGAKVQCVIGNHNDLSVFTEKFEIPFFFVSHENKSKADFENEIGTILANYELDYIVLAKFMRILSPTFNAQYKHQIINIHHSFLPAFIGANPYKQAFERGVKIIGATAHFVTDHLDEGPIISQQTIHVNHTFDAKQMAVAGREIEKAVLSKALEQVLEDRVFVSGNKTIVFE